MAKRKYYRVTVRRIPPYSTINKPYSYEEDVYAYSTEGALNTVEKYHSKGFGSHIPMNAKEISKDEFRGHHQHS